ncbi:MAG: alpha/beta hydrolase [Prevotella sp.]|nr:alpha/beta hydrolase [Prevotella sp.]
MNKKRLLLTLLVCTAVLSVAAQKHFQQNLYSGAPSVKSSDKQDTARVFVFLPDARMSTGKAVVMLPGGGYEHLAMGHEGTEWAPFFNNQGIALVVVKYRMPHGNADVPVSDAEEAIRLVRQNAPAWHVNPSDVGIMGFSAGGHLAATVATHSRDARPDFQILFYPVITMDKGYTHMGSHDNLLGKSASRDEEDRYSNELQVADTTPEAFILLSDDDDIVPPANGVNYYLSLLRHHVPAALYVYPSGGHGYGINNYFRYHYEMLTELRSWLRRK